MTDLGQTDRSTSPREHKIDRVERLAPERCEHEGCDAFAGWEIECSEWVGGRYREGQNYRFPRHYYCAEHLPEDALELAREWDANDDVMGYDVGAAQDFLDHERRR